MKENLSWLIDKPIAHRGLHAPGVHYPENSLSAFQRAVNNGYLIELDVQVTKDLVVAVFHDQDLKRMCDLDLRVDELNEDDLASTNLGNSSEKIPSLRQVLDTVDGRVPILIEVKHWVTGNKNLFTILNSLLAYQDQGLFAIQSFNPFILGWFYEHAPLIPRGQLASSFKDETMNGIKKYLLRKCKLNFIGRPDFIAYEVGALPQRWLERKRNRGTPVLGWTVTSPEIYEQARRYCDNIIFEGFMP